MGEVPRGGGDGREGSFLRRGGSGSEPNEGGARCSLRGARLGKARWMLVPGHSPNVGS
jgi:hypothetical protein